MKKVVPQNSILIPENATKVFSGQIFDVYQWPQKMFDGSEAVFEMLRRPDTVQVIGVIADNIIILEDEQPHKGASTSLPGGRVDETDKSVLSAAEREILEETGYVFDNWRLVSVAQPQPKLEWFVYTFVAWNGRRTKRPHLDPGEKIVARLEPFKTVKQLCLDGVGFLRESRHIFESLNNVDDLLKSPEYSGREFIR